MPSLRRFALPLVAALAGSVLVAIPTGVATAVAGPPVISEVMFNPASAEDDWEWIEIYNPGDETLDLTGWVVDDNNTVALAAANIATGSIPAGGSGVLYNADDVTASDFEAAWGTGINLIAVTGWSSLALNNTGDTIGLWSDFASYSGDNASQANTVISVAFDGSLDDGAGSIYLTDLTDQSSFALSSDGVVTPVGTTITSAAAGGNVGGDVGSPVSGPIDPPAPSAPVISEVMFNPASAEDDWEWIEVYNPGTEPIDMAGYVVDDINNLAHPNANIGAGVVEPGASAILYNADDVTAADFEAAWGTGVNLIAVTNWQAMGLNNGGDTVGIWADFTSYSGDNAVQANALVSAVYGNIDDGAGSVYLTDLADQASFVLSADGVATPVGVTYVSTSGGGNSGADVGSPGGMPPAPLAPIFSQYVEGSGFNKAIEIANVDTVAMDITGWTLELYANGSTSPTTTSTIGTGGLIAPGDVYVASNASAGPRIQAVSDENLAAVNWNGNDAIVLRDLGGNVVDSIGQVGVNPGSEWGDNTIGTQDDTLCRNDDVTVGDTDPGDAFNPAAEWFSLGDDVFTGLGEPGCLDLGPDGNCPDLPNVTKIHEIQGAGAATPCDGEDVVIEGVVVGDYEGASPELRGFYVQEEDADVDGDPATSEGIFVFNFDNDDVNLGDLVRVTSTAGEFQGQTQLGFPDEIVVLDSGQGALVTPTDLSLPVATDDEFEAVEGMSVRFPQELFVTEYFQLGRFGQVVVSSGDRLFNPTQVAEPGPDANAVQAANDLNRLIIDDTLNEQNPEPIVYGGNGAPLTAANPLRGGDVTVGATGVMTFTWAGNRASGDAYRLRPADASSTSDIVFETRNPRPEEKPDVGGSLEVASFNVLNYFLTIDDGSDTCGPIGAKDGCRGADSVEELERQRAKLLAALVELDADVVGLIELENTEVDAPAGAVPVQPLADIVAGLNDLQGDDTWDFVDTGVIGTDVIKVGLIYRTEAVETYGDFAVIDSSVDPRFDDDRNRPTLAQTFVDSSTGEVMTIVVNHLKSKSCREATGADTDQGDGQGCYNASRTAAAEAIVDWLAGDPTGAGDSDVLVIGDLNAYAKEDPIDVFAAAGYVDLAPVYAEPGEETYSFVFDGQWGTLDYALASSSLVDQVTGAAEYHINADEVPVLDYNTNFQSPSQVIDLYAPDQFRTSDHDPVLVGVELDAAPDGRVLVFPQRLWPANGRLRTVVALGFTPRWQVLPTEIVEVTSSQADSGLSRRDRPGDIEIRSDRVVRLRAESFGPEARTYELTIAVRGDDQLRIERETVEVVRRFWAGWW